MTAQEVLRYVSAALLLSALTVAGSHATADDWSTYRGDNRRSGVRSESLKQPLKQAWVHLAFQAPRSAWPELPASRDVWHRMDWLNPSVTYDRVSHVVVADDTLYYGSSADDHVYALEMSTGHVRWSFATEGPVRLAPVVADGNVYVGSDDGCVYCLSEKDGAFLWKYRAGPLDRRLPGNGRMMSLWPVRCGLVVDANTLYFAAGAFPSQGVFLCAVHGGTGQEVWKREIDISPQGYLVASSRHLFVPTGRTAPSVYERADGRRVGKLPGGGVDSRAGGGFALLVDDMLVHGRGEKEEIQVSATQTTERIVSIPGRRLIVQGPTAYVLGQGRLRAFDRTRYLELSRQIAPLEKKKTKTDEEKKQILAVEEQRQACWKWNVSCLAPYELILAGDTIFAGGDNQVIAYGVSDGKTLWTGPVQGKAYGLAVADGRLLVSTDRGAIHCFQHESPGTPQVTVASVKSKDSASPYPKDRWTPLYEKAAAGAIQAAGVTKGYCLVLDAGTGRLAYEIAKRSEFQIVGQEADATKAAVARKLLSEAGLYGNRIVIHHGTSSKLPYQKYFANLIVSDAGVLTGVLPAPSDEVWRVLRPCGGVVQFGGGPALDAKTLKSWASTTVPGWRVQQDSEGVWTGVARRGRLKGAGEWSHFYADSGNSACSQDSIRLGEMDVQWFGRPGPRRMPDRHDKNIGPVYKNGRLFVSGDDYIVGIDAYNGTILWEHDVPTSVRLGAFRHCGSMAATDECLYVAAGDRCLAFDAHSGEQTSAFSIPEATGSGKAEWGYVATVDNVLFGSVTKHGATYRVQDLDTETLIWRDKKPLICSDSLFAYDRRSGKTLWTYLPAHGVIINPTLAIGAGRVYLVESTNPETRTTAQSRITLELLLGQGANLVALDMHTGKTLWKRPAALEAIQHVMFLSYAQETLLITGTKNVSVDGKARVRYDLHAFDAGTGSSLWHNTQKPIPDHLIQGPHGEQVQHSAIVGETIYNTGFACHLRTGEPVEGWKWQKSGNCGTLSTSAACAFSRYANPRIFDLKTGRFAELTRVTRPGCWINVLPAGGMVLIPEASAGCICGYSLQTSVALVPRESP